MLKNLIIRKNFLNPKEKNFKILLKKIKQISKITSSNQARSCPIRKRISNKKISLENNEIPLKPSTSKKIIKKIAQIFEGGIRWNSPYALLNIAPSPLLDVVAVSTIATLYNPNALWDFTAGDIILYEKKVIKALSELVGWDFKSAEGLATYGGKATLMYAIKIDLHKHNLNIINEGIKDNYFVIVSDRAHYSISDICNFLGIGSKNLIKIDTDSEGKMLLMNFKKKVEILLKEEKKIACIILNAGTTIDMCVDPIYEVKKIIIELFDKYKNDSLPHIHADSVAGWAWLFFRNFDKNPQLLKDRSYLKKILVTYEAISQIVFADSFSADFHKTGLSPYCSTFFIVKEHSDLFSLTKQEKSNLKDLNMLGDFHIHHFSFENSRSSTGIVSAWVALQKLGWVGFQRYLMKMLEIGELFKKNIVSSFFNEINIVNVNTPGFETLIKINFFKDKSTWNMILESSEQEISNYICNCQKFKNYIYNKIFYGQYNLPLIGYVPAYKIESDDISLPCFLIYPMCLYTNEKDIVQILNTLVILKVEFETSEKHINSEANISNLALPPR